VHFDPPGGPIGGGILPRKNTMWLAEGPDSANV
jgi:hypothetical protein